MKSVYQKTYWQKPTRGRSLICGGGCLDRFGTTGSIVLGGKNRVMTQALTVGGGGVNVAVGLGYLAPKNQGVAFAKWRSERAMNT